MLSTKFNERPALSSILIIIGFVLIGMVVGNILAAIIMVLVGGIGMNDLANINGALMASPTGWLALMLGQGVAALLTFVAAGMLYWKLVEHKQFSDFNLKPTPSLAIFLFAIVVQLLFIPFNGWLQAANEAMQLPAALKGLEDFMKSMEDNLAEMTTFLTTFDTVGQLILAFIVIAVIAGIGEELIFRGLIQRKLHLAFNNPHIAIWGAAIIFSAIHMQFYGFFPRLMLGAMFGYFYYFTGNLWVPIVCHIFNNGFAVVMLYLSHKKVISDDLEKMDDVPFPAVITSVVLSIGLLWYFQKYTSDESTES